ncbi:MAG: hypothetical protein ABWZ62_04490, partial [Actinomycetota bacterium]
MVTAAMARRRARRRLAVPALGNCAIWSAAPVERWLAPRLSAADVAWPPAVAAQGAALAAGTAGGLGLVGGGPVLALLAVLVVVGAS